MILVNAYSAGSFAPATGVAPDRTPLLRPAIPIDIAAFAYHWSVLKITRRTLFFSGRARETDFLALADLEAVSVAAAPFAATPFVAAALEVMFFAIVITRLLPTMSHLSSGGGEVTVEKRPWRRQRCPHRLLHNLSLMNTFMRSPGVARSPALS